MIIQVDFFKESGKWYSGGECEVSSEFLWAEEFKEDIVNNQNIMQDGWQDSEYYVVTSDLPESEKDRNYTKFFKHLFPIGSFRGIKRKNV